MSVFMEEGGYWAPAVSARSHPKAWHAPSHALAREFKRLLPDARVTVDSNGAIHCADDWRRRLDV